MLWLFLYTFWEPHSSKVMLFTGVNRTLALFLCTSFHICRCCLFHSSLTTQRFPTVGYDLNVELCMCIGHEIKMGFVGMHTHTQNNLIPSVSLSVISSICLYMQLTCLSNVCHYSGICILTSGMPVNNLCIWLSKGTSKSGEVSNCINHIGEVFNYINHTSKQLGKFPPA